MPSRPRQSAPPPILSRPFACCRIALCVGAVCEWNLMMKNKLFCFCLTPTHFWLRYERKFCWIDRDRFFQLILPIQKNDTSSIKIQHSIKLNDFEFIIIWSSSMQQMTENYCLLEPKILFHKPICIFIQ
jgi:hypothetical protein